MVFLNVFFYLWQLYQGRTYSASFSHGLTAIIFIVYSESPIFLAQLSIIQSLIYFVVDLLYRPDLTKIIHHITILFN